MKKTEIKKRKVIEESAKLFYFNGYVNTGLKEILEVCNIPKGSFYYYFKNKDDLLIHVIDYHTNNIIRFFDRTVNDLSIPKFKVFFHNFFSPQFNNMSYFINCQYIFIDYRKIICFLIYS